MSFNVGPVRVQACFAKHPGNASLPLVFASDGSSHSSPTMNCIIRLRASTATCSTSCAGTDVLIMDSQFDAQEYQQHTGWATAAWMTWSRWLQRK